VGNAISDPCFEGASPGAVVCRANPALGQPGFTLQLDAPLPKSTVKHGPPQPWLLLLEDGTACQATTGTLPPVDGEPARWACPPEKPGAEPRYLSGLQPGKVWRAERFTLVPSKQSATGYARGGAQRVAIRTIWE
jgi:hypothetical protein